MDLHHYLVFVSIAFFYIISPGPAVFLAINYGAVHGIKKTALMLLGNSTGLAILATVSAFGLGTLIVQSYILLSIVKFLGAMVLCYLGVKMLLSVFKKQNEANSSENNTDTTSSQLPLKDNGYFSFYKKGLFLALSNPKAIIFFTAIFPQFMTSGESVQNNLTTMLFLGATFAVMSFFCMNTYNILGKKVLAKLLTATGVKVLNLFSGTLFVAMAGILATSDLTQKS